VLNDWKQQLSETRAASTHLAKAHPQLVTAFQGLNAAQGANGVDAKTRELIAVAVAVTTRCDGCIASHARAAREAGAS